MNAVVTPARRSKVHLINQRGQVRCESEPDATRLVVQWEDFPADQHCRRCMRILRHEEWNK